MKKISTIFVLLAALGTNAQFSQNRCGTVDVMKFREENSPGYLQRVNNAFQVAKDIADTDAHSRDAYDTIYRIRCVVHVVYQNAAQNIPDSVIQSQIEVLNEDYRRLNADSIKTRGAFLPVAADARIEFVLATLDPDGNPTTGITRTVGNPSGFLGFTPFDDGVKSNATGGKDPWPTDRYLNIWVCSILNGFGVLGYAFPPDNAPGWPASSGTDSAKQGVVLHYPVVGRNYVSPIDPTVAKGRSAVHEIGHYLGLRHIWGDGDCTADDGLNDTPNANAAHQQTCDTSSNTCTEASGPQVPDMIENYMDYSDDRCLNMFTAEQVGLMRAMLQTSRAGIADRIVETGVKKVDFTDMISLYPNPACNTFTLTFPKGNAKNLKVEIFSTNGLLVYSNSQIDKSVLQVDVAHLSTGIYFVKAFADGATAVKKLVKN